MVRSPIHLKCRPSQTEALDNRWLPQHLWLFSQDPIRGGPWDLQYEYLKEEEKDKQWYIYLPWQTHGICQGGRERKVTSIYWVAATCQAWSWVFCCTGSIIIFLLDMRKLRFVVTWGSSGSGGQSLDSNPGMLWFQSLWALPFVLLRGKDIHLSGLSLATHKKS